MSVDTPDYWRSTGGANAQVSLLERRGLIWNDSDVVAPAAPPAIYIGETLIGKFFTRGCRGMLERLQIYCRRTAAGTLRLRYSPHPCLGPVGDVLITPEVAWGWRAAIIHEMWDYDSLFVWVSTCAADVSWAYDAVEPYDGHESADLEATWADLDVRPFIRAVYTGETPGDVPVSGIVNTIKIPSTGAQVAMTSGVNIPNNTTAPVAYFYGAGTLLQATIFVYDDDLVVPTNPFGGVVYELSVYTEEGLAFLADNRDLTQSDVATSGRSSCGEFLLELTPTSNEKWLIMNLRVPVEFRRYVAVWFYHRAGNPLSTGGRLHANVMG